MGKDLSTKNLLNCPDVFSDIANVNLFDGEELLQPDELEQLPTELTYKDNYGVMSHHYLDTRMKVTEHQADIVIFCIENQSGVSNIMPVRDMGYLYSNYNEQIKKLQREDEEKGIHHITEGNREESQRYVYDKKRRICHPEGYLDMMAAFSSDTRFAKIKENVLKRRKEGEGDYV